MHARAVLDEHVLQPLRAEWSTVNVAFDDQRQAGRNYYTDVCFAVHAVMPEGSRPNLSDGGFTDGPRACSPTARNAC